MQFIVRTMMIEATNERGTTMTFKQLPVQATFEFASAFKPGEVGLGPWMKVSARGYTAIDKENRLYGYRLNVGSINVEVVEV